MLDIKKKNCIIYCRVSSSKQAQQGDSLEDQEKIGYGIAERFNFNTLKVFKEQFSGRKDSRPVIDEIFAYIKANPKKVDVLIFRAIDRFTRNGTLGYETLKQRLTDYRVQLIDGHGVIQPSKNTMEHLGVEYSWSKIFPSEITELVMAQQGKSEVNQILTRMIGAEINLVRDGYHIGPANEGYLNEKVFIEGKKKPIQKADPKCSHFFIKMFELMAIGKNTDQEIVDYINAMGYHSKQRNRWIKNKDKIIGSTGGLKLNVKRLQNIISNPIYCGVHTHKWLSQPIKTRYSGLVSISTFNNANKGKLFIEENKDGNIVIYKDYNPHSIKRTKNNPLFPFKEVILCPNCQKPFLGSSPKGKSGNSFPTYHCCRNHKYYGIPKTEFEEKISSYVSELKHKDGGYLKALEVTLMNKYRNREKELGEFSVKVSSNVSELEAEKKQKIEAYTSTNNQIIRNEIEKQINELHEQIEKAREQRNGIEIKENDIHSFVKYVKYLMEHQEEMLIKQENLTILKALYGLVFDELQTYTQIVNGTPKLSLIYRLSEEFYRSKSLTAGDGGIEPPPKVLETFVLPLN